MAKANNPLIAALEAGIKPKSKHPWYDKLSADEKQWLSEAREWWANKGSVSMADVYRVVTAEPPTGIGLHVNHNRFADWLKEALPEGSHA